MSKWIEFKEVHDTGKTKIFHVVSKDDGFVLGSIYWLASWRKYVFSPSRYTLFEKTCLEDIILFLNGLMMKHKIRKQPATEPYSSRKS
jgi:hypothetical protein